MPSIPFTQFLRPNGRKRPLTIERSETIAAKANVLIGAGYRFEIEELATGMVHMDCCTSERQLANQLVPNGEGVPDAVDKLVQEAFDRYQSSPELESDQPNL